MNAVKQATSHIRHAIPTSVSASSKLAGARQVADFRPQYPSMVFKYLAEMTPKRDTVADIACSTGHRTVGLAPHFTKVYGIDSNIEKLHRAQRADNILYIPSTSDATTLDSNSIDLVTVSTSLFFLNHAKFFAETQRILKPETGTLGVIAHTYLPNISPEVDRLVHHVWRTLGEHGYIPPQRLNVVEWDIMDKIVIPQGFKEICGPIVEATSNNSAIPATKTNGGHPRYSHITQWTLEDLLHYIRTWEYTIVAQNQDNHDPVAPLQKLLEEAWAADANTPKDVRWEFRLRLARKTADA